jgi:hypothetical protein
MKAESTSTLVPLGWEAEDTLWRLRGIIDYLPSREQQVLAKLMARCLASFPGGQEI